MPEGYKPSGNPEEPVDLFFKAVPGNFLTAVAETGCRFSCLLTDGFFWFGADVADQLHVPWIPFWTAGPRALLLHVDIDEIQRRMGNDVLEDKTLDFLPDFSTIRIVDLPQGIIAGDFEATIPSVLNKLGKYYPRAVAIAANTFEELDHIVVNELKSRYQKFLSIGPLALTTPMSFSSYFDEYGCLEWLDKQKSTSVAYISFGSVAIPPKLELLAIIEALEDKKIPFLWSFRDNLEEHLPQKLIQRINKYGKFVPWTSQLKVLLHRAVGVFLTHGGWNSILESIIAGVPMICRPFFGDQVLNMRCIEAVWGIGVGIEGGKFTKDRTLKALELIFHSEKGIKIKQKIEVQKEIACNTALAYGSSIKNFRTLVEIIIK